MGFLDEFADAGGCFQLFGDLPGGNVCFNGYALLVYLPWQRSVRDRRGVCEKRRGLIEFHLLFIDVINI